MTTPYTGYTSPVTPPFPPAVPPKKSNGGKVVGVLGACVLAAITIGAITSNSGNSSSTPSGSGITADTPYTGGTSNSYSQQSTDDRFVTYLQDHDSQFANTPGDTMISTAHSLCTMLENGGTIRQAASMAMSVGYTPTQAGMFLGASVGAYCPQFDSDLN